MKTFEITLIFCIDTVMQILSFESTFNKTVVGWSSSNLNKKYLGSVGEIRTFVGSFNLKYFQYEY